MSNKLSIMGICLDNRAEISPKVQAVLSDYGEQIAMRAGSPTSDRKKGMIALFLEAEENTCLQLGERLRKIDGVSVHVMHF